jgi:transposase
VEGIEPTNTAAVRALYSAVILRKLILGTPSSRGSRYLVRILSVSDTCRLQKRIAYEYLIGVMKAKFAGETAPSLLPLIEDHAAAT